jgi:hypothetical protein
MLGSGRVVGSGLAVRMGRGHFRVRLGGRSGGDQPRKGREVYAEATGGVELWHE